MQPYYDEDGITIYHGDMFDVLPHLTGIGAVITDPPYSSGGAAWCSLWMNAARMASGPGSPIACFTDWRQLPTTTDAVQAGGWIWRGTRSACSSRRSRPPMIVTTSRRNRKA